MNKSIRKIIVANGCFVPLLVGGCCVGTLPIHAGETWREDSFKDFADGTFCEGGANLYVSAAGRIQTINRWDVNGDGFIDIFCPNSHPLVEGLDMSIYWGKGKDFNIKHHTYVPLMAR